jgi:hypothetical protein
MLNCNGPLGTTLQLNSKTTIWVKFQNSLQIYHHSKFISNTKAKNEYNSTSYSFMASTGTTSALVYNLTLNATNVAPPLLHTHHVSTIGYRKLKNTKMTQMA